MQLKLLFTSSSKPNASFLQKILNPIVDQYAVFNKFLFNSEFYFNLALMGAFWLTT